MDGSIQDAKLTLYSLVAYMFMGSSIVLVWAAGDADGVWRLFMIGASLLCLALYVGYLIWELLTTGRREQQRKEDLTAFIQAVRLEYEREGREK